MSERARANVDLLAGLAGGIFAPVATFGFGLPVWASLPGAVLVFLGLRLALAPRRLFEGLALGTGDQAALDLARAVIEEARPDVDRLGEIAGRIRARDVAEHLRRLNGLLDRTLAEVEKRPRRVNSVRRLLTFYLGSAVRLAEGFLVLEAAAAPDRAKMKSAAEMIARLDEALPQLADRISDEDVVGLEADLRLVDQALKEEARL